MSAFYITIITIGSVIAYIIGIFVAVIVQAIINSKYSTKKEIENPNDIDHDIFWVISLLWPIALVVYPLIKIYNVTAATLPNIHNYIVEYNKKKKLDKKRKGDLKTLKILANDQRENLKKFYNYRTNLNSKIEIKLNHILINDLENGTIELLDGSFIDLQIDGVHKKRVWFKELVEFLYKGN